MLKIGAGNDAIADFKDNTDKIGLAGNLTFEQLTISSSDRNTLIKVGQEVLASLDRINANEISDRFR